MKTKNYYLAVTVADENNKHYAYALKVSAFDELKSKLDGVNGLSSANICASKTEARELVNYWNACYKANGSYMFDN